MDKRRFWANVTIFGTLWGGLELTLGTFLHVLHVPKTGLIMVALSAILLVAQRRIFPARGSTLATGVIAACIKGLSPGGIIAGPIFGILSEALIVELCLFLGSRHVFSGILAGAMAVFWCQIQSLFKIWLYYGQDFIASLARVIEKFFRVEWTATLGWSLIGLFLSIVLGIGAIAGFTGWRFGGRILRSLTTVAPSDSYLDDLEGAKPPTALWEAPCEPHAASHTHLPPMRGNSPATPLHPDVHSASPKFKANSKPDISSVVFARESSSKQLADAQAIQTRRFVFPLAILTLFMQFSGDIAWSLGGLFVWILTLFLAARRVLRTIWWPKFWILTFVISAICGVILSWGIDGSWNWSLGIEASTRMIVRGLYVFSLINWLTRCVKSDEFLSIWNKIHIPELGQSLVAAYSLLPRWLDHMNVLLEERPKGILNLYGYIRECFYICILEATREALSSFERDAR